MTALEWRCCPGFTGSNCEEGESAAVWAAGHPRAEGGGARCRGRGTGWARPQSLCVCCCHLAMGTQLGTLGAQIGWRTIVNPGLGEGIEFTASFFRSHPGMGAGKAGSWVSPLFSLGAASAVERGTRIWRAAD